jgi:hypothetical protein
MATEFDRQCDELLMHLEGCGEHSDVATFLAEQDVSVDEQYELVRYLEQLGLVRDQSTIVAAHCVLTGAGRRQAQQLIAQRPQRRAAQLQTRMLRWLDAQSYPSDWTGFHDSDHVKHPDGAYTQDEVHQQAEWLSTNGLVKALRAHGSPEGTIRPELTARGRDCLIQGGDVGAYLGHAGTGATTTYNTTNSQDTHVGAIYGGQNALGSNHVSQIQHNELVAPSYERFAEAVQALLTDAAQRPDLSQEDRDDLAAAGDDALGEVTVQQPDERLVKRSRDALVGILYRIGAAMGGAALQGVEGSVEQWAGQHSQTLLGSLPL